MKFWAVAAVLAAGLLFRHTFAGPVHSNLDPILLDDFESEPHDWKFVGGEEFPGARGSLTIDSTTAFSGKRSYKLEADFAGGGRYVGLWRDLQSLKGTECKAIRLWVKSAGVKTVGVRINDATGQCHQKKGIALLNSRDWQELVLNIADFVGVEHWGGADDGKWHGPALGFGLNIGLDSLSRGSTNGTLHIDQVELIPGFPMDGHPVLLTAIVDPPVCRPGFGSRITYRWDAEAMGHDFTCFVHFIGPDGKMAFQNDHDPVPTTAVWSGRFEDPNTVVIPTDLPNGEYRIMVGLYDHASGERQILKASPDVVAASQTDADGSRQYQVGVLKVDSNAPIPKLPGATLNLDGYVTTFNEDFKNLSVSAWGPDTRWIAHTPGATDFGDARFADPAAAGPFSVDKGILRIEASKHDGQWRSGLLASVDPKGKGFSQKFGYFEMRAKFPGSLGMWPAFWLLGAPSLTDKARTNPEIDVVEQYGVAPNALFATLHLWPQNGKHWARGDVFIAPGMEEQFHNYGVSVEDANIIWYFDGIEISRQKTPEDAKVPLYMLVNLAMGGGWPIDKAVSPSYMFVKHVRVWAKSEGIPK